VHTRLGIDLGGTKCEGVALGPGGEVLERLRVPTRASEGYDAILDRIAEVVGSLSLHAPDAPVGVGIPGSVDRESGRVKNANTTCLIGRPFRSDLERRLGRPVRVSNDANCFVVAESVGGAARGKEVVFGVILGTGVGGGLAFRGMAREGLHGIAGEWGHSPIADMDPEGPPAPNCYCGQRGCVETRLSGPALERDYARLSGEAGVRAPEVGERAARGEPAAQRAVERYLAFFGEALARVIHVVDPDAIVLGGGVGQAPWLLERGPASVERVLFDPQLRTPLLAPALGDSAGVFGAAWLWGGPPEPVE